MDRLRKVFQLPPGERLILLEAWGLFLLVDLALRALPFTRVLAVCKHLSLKAGGAAPSAPSIQRLAWLVEVAGRHVPIDATCLKKALVLSCLLGTRGVATTIRIAVARREETLSAHAWLEREGQVIFSAPGGEGYEPLYPAG